MKISRKIASAVSACVLSVSFFCNGAVQADAYTTIGTEIPVTCFAVTDNSSHIYQVKIESENDISPAPSTDVLQIRENGMGYFEINIDEPGTFCYRIYEEAGSDPNIKYDDNIYIVSVFVENGKDDVLVYSVTASIVGKDTKPETIAFENLVLSETDIVTTTAPPSTTAPPETTTVTTTLTTTAVTTSTSVHTDNLVTRFIDSVLTWDSFPAHVVRVVMGTAAITAVLAFLLRKKSGEEEDENEE